MSELQRVSSSGSDAVRILRAFYDIDVSESVPRIACPTLVIHARGDLRVPFEEGRALGGDDPGRALRAARLATTISCSSRSRPSRGCSRSCRASSRHAGASASFTDAHRARGADPGAHRAGPGQRADRRAARLSEKTVRNHITSIFDKIGVESRAQAIVMAREQGLGRQS